MQLLKTVPGPGLARLGLVWSGLACPGPVWSERGEAGTRPLRRLQQKVGRAQLDSQLKLELAKRPAAKISLLM